MTKILLVGCGKMGQALLSGWIDRGLSPADLRVVDPAGPALAVPVVADPAGLPADFIPEVIVLAVKPQMMAQVLPAYRDRVGDALVVSIAAGKPIAVLREHLGAQAAIIRAMPNTPASVRRGMTVCCAGPEIDSARRALCTSLLDAVGEVGWIDDESLMDAVTALSGSGPAYVFLLAEAMAEAGARLGLAPDLAMRLARATVSGSGELLRLSADSAADLRRAVTSPGGTTAAALDVLMDPQNGVGPVMIAAVTAAARRGRELAG